MHRPQLPKDVHPEGSRSRQEHRRYSRAGLTALFVCALIGAGCGGSNDTTTTTAGKAEQRVDAAIKSCSDQAQQLGGSAGTRLDGACALIGQEVKQVLASGSENVKQTLSTLAKNCRKGVGKFPKGQAQDAFSQLCDAIASAG
jgi:hypothetical protein